MIPFHRCIFPNGSARVSAAESHEYSESFREAIARLERLPESEEDQRLEQYIVSRLRPVKGIEALLGMRGAALVHRSRTYQYPGTYLSKFYARTLYRSMCSAEGIAKEEGSSTMDEQRWECHDRAFEWVQQDLARLLALARTLHRNQPAHACPPRSVTFTRAVREFLSADAQECHPAVAQMLLFLSIEQRLRLLPRIDHHFRLLDDRIHVHVTSPLAIGDDDRTVVKAVTIREFAGADEQQAVAARMRFSFTTRPQTFTALTEQLVREIMREQLGQLRH